MPHEGCNGNRQTDGDDDDGVGDGDNDDDSKTMAKIISDKKYETAKTTERTKPTLTLKVPL